MLNRLGLEIATKVSLFKFSQVIGYRITSIINAPFF